MKITIGHLFYDLLNLYGDSGNILALKNALSSQNIDVDVKNISIEDELILDDLDVVYIGSGTESNLFVALNYLKAHKEDIKSYIESGKFFICTGNSIELFGKIINKDIESIDALGIFEYSTQYGNNRLVSECIYKYNSLEEKILGFENHAGVTIDNNSPLFEVIQGSLDINNNKIEGYTYNNFYSTYLIGPLLVRNPEFLKYMCEKLVLSINPNFIFKDFDLDLEKKAHETFLHLKEG